MVASSKQIAELEETQSEEEIEKTPRGMASDKAPGIDGLTTKVSRRCWDFMKGNISSPNH